MDYLDRTPFKFKKKKVVNILQGEDEEEDLEEIEMNEKEKESQLQKKLDSEKRIDSLSQDTSRSASKIRILIAKEKLKQGIFKQINSLKSCAYRRLKNRSYPESAEFITVGFKV